MLEEGRSWLGKGLLDCEGRRLIDEEQEKECGMVDAHGRSEVYCWMRKAALCN